MASNNLIPQDSTNRQSRNMQQLLNFCTNITKIEDTTKATQMLMLTDERRAFLENVLSGLQGGDLRCIANYLHILSDKSTEIEDDDVAAQEKALDNLSDYVEDLNYALDVLKLNGFAIIVQCLQSRHHSIQIKAANLIANICQNYEECQKAMLEHNAMTILLEMLDNHPDLDCKIKSVYALSCLVRDYRPAEELFVECSGFSSLMRAIQSQQLKLIIKSAFLLNHFIQISDTYKDSLASMGFVEQFVIVLLSDYGDDRVEELCLKSLLYFCSALPAAIEECLRPQFHLVAYLEEKKRSMTDLERFAEARENIVSLLRILSKVADETDDVVIR